MTDLAELIAQLEPEEEGWAVDPPKDWRQGRTLYGGLSAALCHEACLRAKPDLPPLRSAQIAFIGPSAGRALLQPHMLRQGKSVIFMACDLIAGDAVATRGVFVFGGARESAMAADGPLLPEVPAPDDCGPLFGRGGPAFAAHLDQRLASKSRPVSGAAKGELLVWARHCGNAPPSLTSLVALADALPPAAMPRLTAPAAISTVTWQLDIADPEGFSAERWHLIESTEQAAAEGYSLQEMKIWDETGKLVVAARQSVAIFA